jgi:hypothetical protein
MTYREIERLGFEVRSWKLEIRTIGGTGVASVSTATFLEADFRTRRGRSAPNIRFDNFHGREKLRNNSEGAGFAERKLLNNRPGHMAFLNYFTASDARAG